MNRLPRRRFLSRLAAASALGLLPSASAQSRAKFTGKICAFEKFLQSLSYDQLAEKIAALGFDGIEATVRDGGHVLPERVEEDLPKLVAALKKRNLEITLMASSINSVKQPNTEKVLRTAAQLGVKRYRLAYYRYPADKSPARVLKELKPVLRDLVQMSRELKMTGVYQNHAGAGTVGAAVWDIYELAKEYSPADFGIAFDIRHATVEGGQAWPLHFRLVREHLAAIYVKDFRWDGRRPKNVPLGSGQVDPRFFRQARAAAAKVPVSLHVEYLPRGTVAENVAALRQDLAALRRLLG